MKTNKISKSLILSLLIAVLFVGSAWSIENPGKRVEGRKGMNKMPHHMLNLTVEQKEQGKELKLKFIKEITPLKQELRVKKAKLQQISTGDNVDEKAVDKLIEEIGKLKVEMAKKKFAHKQAFRNILTDDQKVIFDANPHKGKKHFKGKHRGNFNGQKGMRNPHMMQKMHCERKGGKMQRQAE